MGEKKNKSKSSSKPKTKSTPKSNTKSLKKKLKKNKSQSSRKKQNSDIESIEKYPHKFPEQLSNAVNFYRIKEQYIPLPPHQDLIDKNYLSKNVEKDIRQSYQEIKNLKQNIQQKMLKNGQLISLMLPSPLELIDCEIYQPDQYTLNNKSRSSGKVSHSKNLSTPRKQKNDKLQDFNQLTIMDNFQNYYIPSAQSMFLEEGQQDDFNFQTGPKHQVTKILQKYSKNYNFDKRYFYKNFDNTKERFCPQALVHKSYVEELLNEAVNLLPRLVELSHQQWVKTYQIFYEHGRPKKEWQQESALNFEQVELLYKDIFQRNDKQSYQEQLNVRTQSRKNKQKRQISKQKKQHKTPEAVYLKGGEVDWQKTIQKVYSDKKNINQSQKSSSSRQNNFQIDSDSE